MDKSYLMEFTYRENLKALQHRLQRPVHRMFMIVANSISNHTFADLENKTGVENDVFLSVLANNLISKTWTREELQDICDDACKPAVATVSHFNVAHLICDLLQTRYLILESCRYRDPDDESLFAERMREHKSSKVSMGLEFIEIVMQLCNQAFATRAALFTQVITKGYQESDTYIQVRADIIINCIEQAVHVMLEGIEQQIYNMDLVTISNYDHNRFERKMLESQLTTETQLAEIIKPELTVIQSLLAEKQAVEETMHRELISTIGRQSVGRIAPSVPLAPSARANASREGEMSPK